MAKETYSSLKNQLDELVLELQSDEVDIDKATELYKKSLQIIKKLETYLKAAKNEIKQIKKT